MTSFFDFLKEPISPAEPGNLIGLARRVNKLMAAYRKETSSDDDTREVFLHRLALARSRPGNALDLLMLILSARQAARALQTFDLTTLDEETRAYWTDELIVALCGMQHFLEENVGSTLTELGFTIENGAMPLN